MYNVYHMLSIDSMLEVTLYYPWQANVNIYYTIQAVRPSKPSKSLTHTHTHTHTRAAMAAIGDKYRSEHYHCIRWPILLCP